MVRVVLWELLGEQGSVRSSGVVRFNSSTPWSVEHGVWCGPLGLCGLSIVLLVGVVAVVFWARLSADMRGRRPCCVCGQMSRVVSWFARLLILLDFEVWCLDSFKRVRHPTIADQRTCLFHHHPLLGSWVFVVEGEMQLVTVSRVTSTFVVACFVVGAEDV